jgi:hypothetical protein
LSPSAPDIWETIVDSFAPASLVGCGRVLGGDWVGSVGDRRTRKERHKGSAHVGAIRVSVPADGLESHTAAR